MGKIMKKEQDPFELPPTPTELEPAIKGLLFFNTGKCYLTPLTRKRVEIYGDPNGLRSFANFLIRIAEFDQSRLADIRLPAGEGLHRHMVPVADCHPLSASCLCGRLDAKADGDVTWFFEGVEYMAGLEAEKRKKKRRMEEEEI